MSLLDLGHRQRSKSVCKVLKRLFGDPRSLSINFDLINNFGVLLINFKVDQLPRPWFFFLYCKNAQKAFISFFLLSTGMC